MKDKDRELEEKKYPCVDCGKLRTAGEGGTTFTVCDECWDKSHKKPTSNVDEKLRDILSECGLDAPDEDEIQKAMGLIEVLYKPLSRGEMKDIIQKRYFKLMLPDITESNAEVVANVLANSIINARGEKLDAN